MWPILLWLSISHHISFPLVDFNLDMNTPFQFSVFNVKSPGIIQKICISRKNWPAGIYQARPCIYSGIAVTVHITNKFTQDRTTRVLPGSSVGRTLAPHARGPGFKSPLGQGFFHIKILGGVGCLCTISYVLILNVLVYDGCFFLHFQIWCS